MKKRSKKLATCNLQPPPILFIHVPFEVFEGYHKRCFLVVPTCNASQRPQSHHHRFTCDGGYRGKGRLAGVGPSPLGHVRKGGYPPPPDGEVWGIEFLLAPAPKPSSEGAPKRQRVTILGAWLQAKGEVQGQVEAPEALPPLPKLGMHCVGVLISPLFRSHVCNLCWLGCPRPGTSSCRRAHLLGSTGGTWEWEPQRR